MVGAIMFAKKCLLLQTRVHTRNKLGTGGTLVVLEVRVLVALPPNGGEGQLCPCFPVLVPEAGGVSYYLSLRVSRHETVVVA